MKCLSFLVLALFIHLTVLAKEIKTEIIIQASPETIWTILTDFDAYPQWNPFIVSIKGNAIKGNKIEISIYPPDGKPMTFKAKVLESKEKRELIWLGTFLFRGLFDGKHTFELIDNGNGTTTFVQRETFKGIFVWAFNTRKTENGFHKMNQKLKEIAEK